MYNVCKLSLCVSVTSFCIYILVEFLLPVFFQNNVNKSNFTVL